MAIKGSGTCWSLFYYEKLRLTYKNSFAGTNAKMQVLIRYKDRLKKYKKLIAKSGVSKNTKYSYKKF